METTVFSSIRKIRIAGQGENLVRSSDKLILQNFKMDLATL